MFELKDKYRKRFKLRVMLTGNGGAQASPLSSLERIKIVPPIYLFQVHIHGVSWQSDDAWKGRWAMKAPPQWGSLEV